MKTSALVHPEAERTVLGGILVDGSAMTEVAPFLLPAHFATPGNRRLFEAMQALFERGDAIDLVTVKNELGDDVVLCGGVAGIAALCDGVPRITNAEQWGRIVVDKAKRRATVDRLERALVMAKSDDHGTDEVIADAVRLLQEIVSGSEGGVQKIDTIIPDAVKAIEEFAVSKTGITGIPTGFCDFDQMTRGMGNGALWIVGGRPGRGKSTFLMQIATCAALNGFKVLVFSMEMPPDSVTQRMLLSYAGLDRWDLRPPDRRMREWGEFNKAVMKISPLPIWFDKRESPTIVQIRATAKQQSAVTGVDLVVVDYIQRCSLPSKQERWEAVGEIAKGLKSLARSLNVPVLAACQLTADAEEKRPTLADLAQARQVISAEADLIAFLHPEKPTEWRTETHPQINLLVDKQRDGEMASLPFSFEKSRLRFLPMAPQYMTQ